MRWLSSDRRLRISFLSPDRLIELFPATTEELLQVRGLDLLETLGLETIRDVVKGVLSGVNVRSATEALTRRRLALLNAGFLWAYLRGQEDDDSFVASLAARAAHEYFETRSRYERTILRWILGLTGKQVQNAGLRSDRRAWDQYVRALEATLQEASEVAESQYGPLTEQTQAFSSSIDWSWALHFTTAIGAQTLAIRGSEKSLYGKFFEKLVLGGVLHVLGFRLVAEDQLIPKGYWLSSRSGKRECDATAVMNAESVVRFDLGFIGAGNSEISLDKVSRFERVIELDGHSVYARTFIIVDRIGKNSRVPALADEIDGTIIQMSASYWPQTLGDELAALFDDYESPLSGLSEHDLAAVISDRIDSAPFERIFDIAAEVAEEEANDSSDDDDEALDIE